MKCKHCGTKTDCADVCVVCSIEKKNKWGQWKEELTCAICGDTDYTPHWIDTKTNRVVCEYCLGDC